MNPNVILWDNNIFIKINSNQTLVESKVSKYHRGSVSGLIFDEIVTYDEILSSCPGCTEHKNLHDALK